MSKEQELKAGVPMPKGPRRIDFEAGYFLGVSGKRYNIEGSLSVERYAHFQLYEKELAYGMTVKGMYERMKKLYETINKQKFADAAVQLTDIMRGVSKLPDRQPSIMKICALFMNLEDENRGIINQDMIDKKITDWADIDITDFFRQATGSVGGLVDVYMSVAQAISQMPPIDPAD